LHTGFDGFAGAGRATAQTGDLQSIIIQKAELSSEIIFTVPKEVSDLIGCCDELLESSPVCLPGLRRCRTSRLAHLRSAGFAEC
jgi:hypothetical protein